MNEKMFCLFHQNIQSIGTSFLRLQKALVYHEVDILFLTEHWKSEEELRLYIPHGYNLSSAFCRDRGRHSGCAILVQQGMYCLERLDLKSLSVDGSFECCASQTIISNDKYLIVCIYRPNTAPVSNIEIFFEKFILILDQCLLENARLIVAGDFNIDLLSD